MTESLIGCPGLTLSLNLKMSLTSDVLTVVRQNFEVLKSGKWGAKGEGGGGGGREEMARWSGGRRGWGGRCGDGRGLSISLLRREFQSQQIVFCISVQVLLDKLQLILSIPSR